MLKGRLGLDSARVPQADRHGLLWLSHGRLYAERGTLRFTTAGQSDLPPGEYAIPLQMLTCVVLQPGTTVTHDALRLLAGQDAGLLVVGEGAVRMYASMPAGPDRSARARRHARKWADPDTRMHIARRMYAFRLGEVLPAHDIAALRGIEGARVKEMYRLVAQRFGVRWRGRRYDRKNPDAADIPNQALNHAATATYAVAEVAVAVTGAVRQLGFIHEESGRAFALDIADLFRHEVTVPIAFEAAKAHAGSGQPLERLVRKAAAREFRKAKLVSKMIDRIKELLDDDDRRRDP